MSVVVTIMSASVVVMEMCGDHSTNNRLPAVEKAVSYTHLDVYKRQQVEHVSLSSMFQVLLNWNLPLSSGLHTSLLQDITPPIPIFSQILPFSIPGNRKMCKISRKRLDKLCSCAITVSYTHLSCASSRRAASRTASSIL